MIVYSNEWDKSKQRIKDRIPYDNKKRTAFNNSVLDIKMEIQQAYDVSTGELDKDWLVKFFERKYHPEKHQDKTEENFFSFRRIYKFFGYINNKRKALSCRKT